MVRLSDICDVRDGTHDSPKYVEYGYPLVTSKNIKDGQLDLSIVNFITEEDYNKINERSNVDVGDIIMPMIGTIGNPYLVEEFCDFAIKNVALIKCDNVKVINRFVWYFLQSNAFERYVDAKNKGGTQKFLSLGDIRTIELPVVSTDGQKNIIKILRCVDGIIGQRKQQLQKLDELVKARFVEMFGDDNCSYRKVEELCDSIVDCPHTTPKYNGELKHPAIRTSEIKKGFITWDSMRYVSDEEYEERTLRLKPKAGDIVYGREGSFGNAAILPNGHKFCLGQRVMLLRPNYSLCTSEYLLYAVISDDVYNQAIGKNNASTVAHVNVKDVKQFKVALPTLEKQKEFGLVLKQIDKSKLSVQNSLDKLETLKKALMQKYFG